MASPRVSVWAALFREILLAVAGGIALAIALFLSEGRLVPSLLSRSEFVLLDAGVIVLVAYLVSRAFGRAIQRVLDAEGSGRHVSLVRLTVNGLIAVLVAFALFGLSGVSLQNLFFGSALAGIVLGLASQTVLGNVFAGLVIVLVGPFRSHERISIVSSSYGAIWPTYAHELMYPTYSGTVLDIGLFYTTLQLDSGRVAKIPNSVVLTALVVQLTPQTLRSQRVRLTLPLSVPLARLEAAIPPIQAQIRGPRLEMPPPHLEVADIAQETWDAVVVVWTTEPSEEQVRDSVLRVVLSEVLTPPVPRPPPAPSPPGTRSPRREPTGEVAGGPNG